MEEHPARVSLLSRTKSLLRQSGLRAKKGLGQHFLVDGAFLGHMLRAAEISPQDNIVEVGPGLGTLTDSLATQAGHVVGIEKDERLALLLSETLAERGNVTIVNKDILTVELPSLLEEQFGSGQSYKLVANLPYFIAAPVLRVFLEAENKPKLVVVMVQREVAQQIVAKPGDMSILSVAVQLYGEPRIVKQVPSKAFYPPPKVDSAILRINVFDRPRVDVQVESYFRVVKAGFSAARKQIVNPLAHGLGLSKEELRPILNDARIDPRRRAETLSLEEWAALWRSISAQQENRCRRRRTGLNKVTVPARAKINLTLEVLGRRGDGYHEVRTILQTISLSDELVFEEADDLRIVSDVEGWAAEKSLVTKAASLLGSKTGTSRGARITVKKRIPLSSGLGGDSSDAAATLKGLDDLWGSGCSFDSMGSMAASLGSDVPFFLAGGTAAAEGRGEIVRPLPAVGHLWLVVILSQAASIEGKTREMYRALTANHFTDGTITQTLTEAIVDGQPLESSMLFNAFENVAFLAYPGLSTVRTHVEKMGARHVHLAGSGPALYCLADSGEDAAELAVRLKGQGLTALVAETISG